MKSFALGVAAAALVAISAPAAAVTAIIYTPSGAVPGYIGPPTTFEDFTPNLPNGTVLPIGNGTPVGLAPGVSGSSTGIPGRALIYNNSVSGQGIAPIGGTAQFLSILAGGAYTLNFATPAQVVSFAFSTLDAGNRVTLNFVGGTSQTLNGLGIIGSPTGVGLQSGGRATYDRGGGLGITSIIFSSSVTAFEIDSVLSAAPEPGTWGMMILGFGIAGTALRTRRRAKGLATA